MKLFTTPMLSQYSDLQLLHARQMLQMYRTAIQSGRLQKTLAESVLGISSRNIESRWYGEIRRRQRLGEEHDWKTMLNGTVLRQMEAGDRSTELLD